MMATSQNKAVIIDLQSHKNAAKESDAA